MHSVCYSCVQLVSGKVFVVSLGQEREDNSVLLKQKLKSFQLIAVLLFSLNGNTALAATTDEPPEMNAIVVEVEVPSNHWKLSVDEVYEIDDELWVISSLKEISSKEILINDMFNLTEVVGVFAKQLPIRYYFVSNKMKNKNSNDDSKVFIKSKDELRDDMIFGRRLYSANDAE